MDGDQPEAELSSGPSSVPLQVVPRPADSAPTNSQTNRTLSGLWGTAHSSSSSSFLEPSSSDETKASQAAANTAGAQRKRRKKVDDAGQARLVFGAGGMGVGAPPPPPPPVEKKDTSKVSKKRQTKRKGEGGDTTQPTAGPSSGSQAKKRGRQSTAGRSADGIVLSPDSSPEIVALASSSAPDVMVLGSTRPVNPFVSRANGNGRNSRSGSGAPIDPILLDDSDNDAPKPVAPTGPKKIVFASDTKPAHSFFGRGVGTTASGTTTPATVGTTVASTSTSGIATPIEKVMKRPTHSFFSLVARVPAPGTLQSGWGCCREGEEPPAPWPGGEWPVHLGYEAVEHGAAIIPRRARPTHVEDTSEAFGSRAPTTNGTHQSGLSRQRSPASILPFIAQHPAITAVLYDTTQDDGRESWCERHRPRTASAVLGNEVEATYLRDWLQALSVGSAGDSRRVLRRIPPRRAAVNPDRAWLVDDAGIFGEPFTEDAYDDSEIPDIYNEPILPLGARPRAYPQIGNWVGNTVLLTGPGGSGKSAAVYAVASELGWDVFEVYPGIGRRTGANLMSLVGDVGKNHMVHSRDESKTKKTAADAARALFGGVKVKKAPAPPSSQGSATAPINLDDDVPVEPRAKPESKPKQSLILIDEADILFEEEQGTFWSTIIGLIAESRRPVVITCNDLERVPIDYLPLQTILYFRPPASYLAQPYLSAIAEAHSIHCDSAELYAQCSRSSRPDLVNQPLPPNGNEPENIFDLRAAFTQLQLDRNHAVQRLSMIQPSSQISHDESMATAVCALDAASFADAFIAPRPWARLEITEVDRFASGPDDQTVTNSLLKPDVQDMYPSLAAFSHSEEIAAAVVDLAGHVPALDREQLQIKQTAYVRGLLPVLDPVVPLTARLLPHPTLFMETVPFVRNAVVIDDALEAAGNAAYAAGELRINRKTGRAIRGTNATLSHSYHRYIDLATEVLQTSREGGLCVDW